MKYFIRLACLTFVFTLGALSTSFAQKVTPNHVFQLVDTAYQELERFHDSDFSQSPDANVKIPPRKPRHVLQKAQEVYIKVQNLRRLNGLTQNPIHPIPVRQVTPGDVKKSIEKILEDLENLKSIYNIKGTLPPVHLPTDKTPTDVYQHLSKVSASLDALGLPVVVPNDVYRIAETVVIDLEKLVQHKKLYAKTDIRTFTGKTPSAVYDHTHLLLVKLRDLTEQSEYQIKGGVILLNKPQGAIKPAHVMDGLGNAIAEIGAIKYKAGMTQPTQFANLKSGKTPSDVFARVQQAHDLVDILMTGHSNQNAF